MEMTYLHERKEVVGGQLYSPRRELNQLGERCEQV